MVYLVSQQLGERFTATLEPWLNMGYNFPRLWTVLGPMPFGATAVAIADCATESLPALLQLVAVFKLKVRDMAQKLGQVTKLSTCGQVTIFKY